MAEYAYDAWGRMLSVTGTLADIVGRLNPMRYRGYYYDSETGYYYLQSRYYDPEIGRFINADASHILQLAKDQSGGMNLFAYCFNDPVNYRDESGYLARWLIQSNFIYNYRLYFPYYIYGQSYGNASKAKFGYFQGNYNGCGWIALYNALRMIGKPKHPSYIIYHLEHSGQFAGGAIGVMPWGIQFYLLTHGIKFIVTTGKWNIFTINSIARNAKANILLYFYSGFKAHYVAFKKSGSSFLVYNHSNRSKGTYRTKSLYSYMMQMGGIANILISIF